MAHRLCFLVSVVLVLCAGCNAGGRTDGEAVAIIAGREITKQEYSDALANALAVAVPKHAQRSEGRPAEACADRVARDWGVAVKVARRRCDRVVKEAGRKVLRDLLTSVLVRRISREQGVVVAQRDVSAVVEQGRPLNLGVARRLVRSGLSLEELKQRASGAIRMPTVAAIRRLYDREREQFVAAETRRVLLASARTRSGANEYRAIIKRTGRWGRLGLRSLNGNAVRGNADAALTIVAGEDVGGLGGLLFKLRQGVLSGPVRWGDRWVVAQVIDVRESYVKPFAEAKKLVGEVLLERKQEAAVRRLSRTLRRKVRDEAKCLGPVLEACRAALG